MERMILNRPYWLIEAPPSDLLPNNQFGFRKFRFCQDNLTALAASIHLGFLNKQATVAVFVDIKSAFDNVLPQILLQDLRDLDFPPLLLSFISNLISHRTVQFISQGTISEPRTSFKGTPQGSVLSPTLFNLYLRGVNDALHPDTELLQFADDIVIFSSSKDTRSTLQSVELSLQGLEVFLQECGLEISRPKTRLMIFSNKRSTTHMNCSISFQNQHILPSPTVRFLGVLLDPRLSGQAHMSFIIDKGRRTLQIIQALRDSKSVLEAVKSYKNPSNNYLIPLIKSVVEEAESKGIEIYFIWIPSHRGVEGNEKADQLAKRAIRQGIEPNFKVPYSDLCAVIKQNITDSAYHYLESQADIKGSYFFSTFLRGPLNPGITV
ncbi:RNA-directed DNA polymerase from mobile element jockey-like [Mycetomoellerius zeteki]|uniref:RNA-directed DNA polymerase from mobile element jockey-like n=1 Tax=Mycetomoellerius zeteki TaxID=64791 RepID=UPI00084EA742|nr:PREDICTED: RNA-directed DNA polymerase from mobile element jockey-like [Trachymyrmex zeteki]